MSVKVSPRSGESRRPRSPYEPFATAIKVLMTMTVIAVALGAAGVITGDGQMFGIGDPGVCVRDDSTIFISGGNDTPRDPGAPPSSTPYRPGVAVTPVTHSLCLNEATPLLKTWEFLTEAPMRLVYLVTLIAFWRLMVNATRQGPFDRGNVRRLRFIGWWIALGGTVATVCQGAAHAAIVRGMLKPRDGWSLSFGTEDISFQLILTGLGLLVVARILEAGVRMHEDLEGTV